MRRHATSALAIVSAAASSASMRLRRMLLATPNARTNSPRKARSKSAAEVLTARGSLTSALRLSQDESFLRLSLREKDEVVATGRTRYVPVPLGAVVCAVLVARHADDGV